MTAVLAMHPSQEIAKAVEEQHPRDNASDPAIFRRRRYAYTIEELRYIRRLAPLESLPRSLVRTPQSSHPPQMHYALLLTDAAKEMLLNLAAERQFTTYACKFADDDSDLDLDSDSEDDSDEVDEFVTLDLVAGSIVDDLGVKLPVSQFIDRVMTPNNSFAFCFTLYTNYELNRAPSSEDIEKIQSYLGLIDRPFWYPNAFRFQWVE
ncbi:hypothetical protein NM688_g727 [Phlebia brevispora]|uniref:Uncharacterized protein n=1 Tax=Phlebia brevispora TaxID=194682 RepID=A0ACC1TDK4_9APHY|nr:hypothetical protein NM688_g727 [Phlebia brevispora]